MDLYVTNKNQYIELCQQICGGDCMNCPLYHVIRNNWRSISDWYTHEYGLDMDITKCYYVALILLLFTPLYRIQRIYVLGDLGYFDNGKQIFSVNEQYQYIKSTIMKRKYGYDYFKQYLDRPETVNQSKDNGMILSIYLGTFDHGFLLDRRMTGVAGYQKYQWVMYQSWIDVKGLHIVNLSTPDNKEWKKH